MSAPTITSAPATYKQPSRKGKKAWRKNVNVEDIHEGLETAREEIRLTGGIVSEKPNDELFTLDLTGSQIIKKAHLKAAKMLKVDEILSQRSAVPPVSSCKRPLLEHERSSMVTDGIIREKKRRKDGISYKELQRLKNIVHGKGTGVEGEATVPVAQKKANEMFDPWAEKLPEPVKPEESFLPKKVDLKEPKTLKMPPVVLTKTKNRIPAVKVPDAGISYNPEFTQWEELLRREGEKAVEEEKKKLKEEQEGKERLERMAQLKDEEKDAEEEEEEEEQEEQEEDPTSEQVKLFKKRQIERKTQAQRNKAKKRKEEERKLAMLKLEKKKRQQLEQLKQITKAVIKKENAKLEKLAKEAEEAGNMDEAEAFRLRKKKFGKQHLPRAPLELQLPDELTDSLRRLKPEGNLLRERFRSLMERGIVEMRVPVTRKKAKTIVAEKWSYKDFK